MTTCLRNNKRFCFFSRTFYHCSIFTGRRFASLSKRNISPLLFLKNKVHLEMVQRFVQPFSFDVTIHSSLFLIVQLAYHHTLYAIYPFLKEHFCFSSYTSLRPSNAFDSVTSSAYSKSPPTGRPCAIRVTLIPVGFRGGIYTSL